jgi:hypothetical protein
MNTQQRAMAVFFLVASLLLSGCGSGQPVEPPIAPTPTFAPTQAATPTNTPLPTATPTPVPPTPKLSPTPLPLTTQPKCWTVLTANETNPENITGFGQSEITFELEGGSLQTVVKGGRLVIEQMEVKELAIGGKGVTLTSQQLSGETIQTEEFGRLIILVGDPTGGCMVIVASPDQFAQIVNWLQ